jgi:hypothetical protein
VYQNLLQGSESMWIDPEERLAAATQKIADLEATVAELTAKVEAHQEELYERTVPGIKEAGRRIVLLEEDRAHLVQEFVDRLNEHILGAVRDFHKTANDAGSEALATLRTAADRVASDLAREASSRTATLVDATVIQQVIEKNKLVAPTRVQTPATVIVPGPSSNSPAPKTQPKAYGAK